MAEQNNAIADYQRKLNPQVYNSEGIDRIIISNSIDSNTMLRKVPHLVKKPVYLLNEKKEKIPFKNENGKIVLNENGEVQYIISDYNIVQEGFETRVETCAASEIISPDMTSSNLTFEQYQAVIDLIWEYNYLQVLQMNSNKDYSFELHQLRNDINAIIIPAKSLFAGSVQAVKTFRTISDVKQDNTVQEQKKPSMFDKLIGGVKGTGQPQQQSSPYYIKR